MKINSSTIYLINDQLMRYNINGIDELICKIDSSEIYLIGDNQMLELIWENQFKWGTLSG